MKLDWSFNTNNWRQFGILGWQSTPTSPDSAYLSSFIIYIYQLLIHLFVPLTLVEFTGAAVQAEMPRPSIPLPCTPAPLGGKTKALPRQPKAVLGLPQGLLLAEWIRQWANPPFQHSSISLLRDAEECDLKLDTLPLVFLQDRNHHPLCQSNSTVLNLHTMVKRHAKQYLILEDTLLTVSLAPVLGRSPSQVLFLPLYSQLMSTAL